MPCFVEWAPNVTAIRSGTARSHRATTRRNVKLHDGPQAGGVFRKFGISYANLHPMRDEVRQAFIDARNTQSIREVLAMWYDDQREWPVVKSRETLTDLIAAGAES